MKKIKQLIVKHWINAALLLLVGIVAWFSIRYALKYSDSAKTTNDIRAVWQLALTAIAGSVGVGTIINSARSASTAAESMRANKDKEKREQSSHLIASCNLDHFLISPPMYRNDSKYEPVKEVAQNLEKFFSENEPNMSVDKQNKYAKDSFFDMSKSMRDKRVTQFDVIAELKILNIGKGVSVNLDYSFDFVNIDRFKNYSVVSKNKNMNVSGAVFYPPYDISTQIGANRFVIEITDSIILNYAERIKLENHMQNHLAIATLIYENDEFKGYKDYLKPGEETSIPIPNNFMLLCKHYVIMTFYKKWNEKNKFHSLVRPNVDHLILNEAINPIGQVTIRYYDEEEVRTKSEEQRSKQTLVLQLQINEDSIYREDDKIHFYLEVTPILSKPKRKKNEPTAK